MSEPQPSPAVLAAVEHTQQLLHQSIQQLKSAAELLDVRGQAAAAAAAPCCPSTPLHPRPAHPQSAHAALATPAECAAALVSPAMASAPVKPED